MLVDVRGVKVHFPIKRGVIFDRTVGYVYAVDGIDLQIQPWRDLRPGRRVRLRQVDPRQGDPQPRDGHRGLGALRRARTSPSLKGEDPAPQAAAHADGLPGPDVQPRPPAVGRVAARRGDAAPTVSTADKAATHARLKELLGAVGLPPAALSKYPHEFSGGQRQRIGIARALCVDPQLIVADEPVSALDVSVQAQVINLLEELQDEFGLTFLVVAHDLAVVRHISDRIGVMYLGGLVEESEAGELYDRPLHPYTRALMSAVPVPDPVVEDQRRADPADR